jgi:release factor glutamine methyltransferase
VRIGVLPGVWPPHRDAWLLASQTRPFARGADVLDVFTGSGALAVTAAISGARSVTAVDLSRRALLSVRINAWRNGCRVRVRRGDMLEPVRSETFDLIVANPPYIPGPDELPSRGIARAWEGGADGRKLIDPLLEAVPEHLRPGGRFLLLHSSMNGEQATQRALARQGLETEVVLRHAGPVGRITRQRARELVGARLLESEAEPVEETLVFLATKPSG